MTASSALIERFDAALPSMLDDIERLVSCESPSADLAAVAASAGAVTAVGRACLGAEPERIVLDGCTHLRWRFGPAPSRVLVLAHHDTVWPIGSLATHPFGVEGGLLRGPGCYDMKAGLVMSVHALAALGAPDGVTLLVTGDEELSARTSRTLIEDEARRCRAVLVTEGATSDGSLKTRRKGYSSYEIRVHGRAAHAGLAPETGVNATVELARQIPRIAALADPATGTSVVPTLLSAGTTTNTVPAFGRVAVDVRAWDAAEQQRVDRALRALRPALEGARVEIAGGPDRAPLESASSEELFTRAQTVAARLGMGQLGAAAVGGVSDGNIAAGVGAPTLDGLGAVGDGAHADSEHLIVAELPRRTALLAALIADILDATR